MTANTYTTVNNQTWFSERCRIATGNDPVTYNVFNVEANANIFSDSVILPADEVKYVLVGVGNKLTVTGSGFTASEAGSKGRQV